MATNKTITVTAVSVGTGDTLASYNAYSDKPTTKTSLGTLSIAEAAAGKVFALTDGLNHNITVYPVGTSSGEFNAASNSENVDLSTPSGITDISTLTATGKTLDVSANIGVNYPTSIIFNPSRSTMAMVGVTDDIDIYTMSTTDDITTASLTTTFIPNDVPLVSGKNNITGIAYADSGNKLFFTSIAAALYSANLATPYSISSWINEASGLYSYGALSSGRSLAISPDGTKIIASMATGDVIKAGTLSTPFVLSTFTETGSFDCTSTATADYIAVAFDGSFLIFASKAGNSLYQLDMSTGWDLTTAGAITKSLDVGAISTISINDDATKIYVANTVTKVITEYA
jgi:hypothetical protein